MKIIVNGEAMETEAATLDKLLRHFELTGDGKGWAVAVNDTVVPRNGWRKYGLAENDHIEIIHATQGG